MTPEAQRIAIAEACGWKIGEEHRTAWWYVIRPSDGAKIESSEKCQVVAQLPNYLSDLNVMHEAEKVLTPQQQSDYSFSLSAGWMSDRRDNWRGCHATATQRAEAFLRTLNFWKDNQNGKP